MTEKIKPSGLESWAESIRRRGRKIAPALVPNELRSYFGKVPGGETSGILQGKARRLIDRVREDGLGGPVGPVLLAAIVFGGYEATRYRPLGGIPQAIKNGGRILRLERFLGMPDEVLVQEWALRHPTLVVSANWFYLLGHFPIMIPTLAWVYRCQREQRRTISTLLFTTAVAFAIMSAFPLAPPRLLEGYGFVDTMKVFGPYIYDSPEVAATANQYAAMPSLHVGWALWVAWTLIRTTNSPWRWFSLAHPVITSAGVVVTANHFWLDGVVGAALLAASVRITGNVYPEEA